MARAAGLVGGASVAIASMTAVTGFTANVQRTASAACEPQALQASHVRCNGYKRCTCCKHRKRRTHRKRHERRLHRKRDKPLPSSLIMITPFHLTPLRSDHLMHFPPDRAIR